MSNPRRPAVPGDAPRDTLDGLRGVLRFVREQLYLDDEDEHPLTDACYAAMRALKASPDEPRGEAGDSTPPPPADNEPRCMRCNEERMLGHGVCVNCHDAVREAMELAAATVAEEFACSAYLAAEDTPREAELKAKYEAEEQRLIEAEEAVLERGGWRKQKRRPR